MALVGLLILFGVLLPATQAAVLGEACTAGTCTDTDSECATVCVCKTGFQPVDAACVEAGTCTDTDSECATVCVCKTGFQPVDAACVEAGTCTDTDSECATVCVCKTGFQPVDAACVEDGAYSTTCAADGDCTDQNLECDVTGTGTCQCLPAYHYIPAEGACFRVVVHDQPCSDDQYCQVNGDSNMLCVGSLCACATGYEISSDGLACIDKNECLGAHGCSQACNNTDGSFICTCEDGYVIASDNVTCEDLDECTSATTHVCDDASGHGVCKNTNGTYVCTCDSAGYSWNTTTVACEDVDECGDDVDECDDVCNNTVGSYTCQCGAGYTLNADEKSCDDIDECLLEDTFNCSGLAPLCNNIPGSYECTCDTGYAWNVTLEECEDVDECQDGSNGSCDDMCENTIGSYNCSCGGGFSLTDDGHTCEDIDECVDPNICSDGRLCFNSVGDYRCECDIGYVWNENATTCENLDECLEANGGCSDICTDSVGSFACECLDGYTLSADLRTCRDADECTVDNGGCTHTCVNTGGSRECICRSRYRLKTDKQTCDPDGIYVMEVQLKFTGTFLSWMSDKYESAKSLMLEIEYRVQPFAENKFKENYGFLSFYVTDLQEGSIRASADLTFQNDLTQLQEAYIAFQLSQSLVGVTVTSGNITLLVASTNNLRFQGDTLVTVTDACSLLDAYDTPICDTDHTCTEVEDGEPYCKCKTDAAAGCEDYPTSSDDDDDDDDGWTDSKILMVGLLAGIPVLVIAFVVCILCLCLRRRRSIYSQQDFDPYQGYNGPEGYPDFPMDYNGYPEYPPMPGPYPEHPPMPGPYPDYPSVPEFPDYNSGLPPKLTPPPPGPDQPDVRVWVRKPNGTENGNARPIARLRDELSRSRSLDRLPRNTNNDRSLSPRSRRKKPKTLRRPSRPEPPPIPQNKVAVLVPMKSQPPTFGWN